MKCRPRNFLRKFRGVFSTPSKKRATKPRSPALHFTACSHYSLFHQGVRKSFLIAERSSAILFGPRFPTRTNSYSAIDITSSTVSMPPLFRAATVCGESSSTAAGYSFQYPFLFQKLIRYTRTTESVSFKHFIHDAVVEKGDQRNVLIPMERH